MVPLSPGPTGAPRLLIGSTDATQSADASVGSITLLDYGNFLLWDGLNATNGNPPTPTGGFATSAGTDMVTIDDRHQVTLRVGNKDAQGNLQVVVHNGTNAPESGSVWILDEPLP